MTNPHFPPDSAAASDTGNNVKDAVKTTAPIKPWVTFLAEFLERDFMSVGSQLPGSVPDLVTTLVSVTHEY
jgi:hypothetical protein